MPARAQQPSTAPVTRRQLREAERRAAQVRPRESAAPLAGTVHGTHGATADRSPAVDPAPAADGPAAPYRTRAELRAAERAAQQRQSRHLPRWMPRAAVLGALGAATIVAPLTGFVGADQGAAEQVPEVATVPAGQTLLDALDAAATQHDTDAAGSSAALLADSGASARALVNSSRSTDRADGLMCAATAGSGANGAGAALGGEPVVMPLTAGSYRQSSLYGDRVHPISGVWSKHEGLDFAAPLGTDIHSVADGVVVHAGEGLDGRSSMLVIIEHEVEGQTFYSWYVHMYPDGVFVAEGQKVRAGEVIGEVGNNGNSTGPHLHLEIHLDEQGTTTDPGAFLADHDAIRLSGSC